MEILGLPKAQRFGVRPVARLGEGNWPSGIFSRPAEFLALEEITGRLPISGMPSGGHFPADTELWSCQLAARADFISNLGSEISLKAIEMREIDEAKESLAQQAQDAAQEYAYYISEAQRIRDSIARHDNYRMISWLLVPVGIAALLFNELGAPFCVAGAGAAIWLFVSRSARKEDIQRAERYERNASIARDRIKRLGQSRE